MVKNGEIPQPSQAVYIDMIAKVILFQQIDKIVRKYIYWIVNMYLIIL